MYIHIKLAMFAGLSAMGPALCVPKQDLMSSTETAGDATTTSASTSEVTGMSTTAVPPTPTTTIPPTSTTAMETTSTTTADEDSSTSLSVDTTTTDGSMTGMTSNSTPFCGDSNVDEGEECDDGSDDYGDNCNFCFYDRYVFITESEYCGDMSPYDADECGESELTGVAGGDMLCNGISKPPYADRDGYTYRAWLSNDFESSPYKRFNAREEEFEGRYILLDDSVVAYGWTSLTSKDLVNGILVTNSQTPLISPRVWTGTAQNGTGTLDGNCDNWAGNDEGSHTAYYGEAAEVSGGRWTYNMSTQNCGLGAHIYCFQDPEAP